MSIDDHLDGIPDIVPQSWRNSSITIIDKISDWLAKALFLMATSRIRTRFASPQIGILATAPESRKDETNEQHTSGLTQDFEPSQKAQNKPTVANEALCYGGC